MYIIYIILYIIIYIYILGPCSTRNQGFRSVLSIHFLSPQMSRIPFLLPPAWSRQWAPCLTRPGGWPSLGPQWTPKTNRSTNVCISTLGGKKIGLQFWHCKKKIEFRSVKEENGYGIVLKQGSNPQMLFLVFLEETMQFLGASKVDLQAVGDLSKLTFRIGAGKTYVCVCVCVIACIYNLSLFLIIITILGVYLSCHYCTSLSSIFHVHRPYLLHRKAVCNHHYHHYHHYFLITAQTIFFVTTMAQPQAGLHLSKAGYPEQVIPWPLLQREDQRLPTVCKVLLEAAEIGSDGSDLWVQFVIWIHVARDFLSLFVSTCCSKCLELKYRMSLERIGYSLVLLVGLIHLLLGQTHLLIGSHSIWKNMLLLENIEGPVWYIIYHRWPIGCWMGGNLSYLSANQWEILRASGHRNGENHRELSGWFSGKLGLITSSTSLNI